jgi:hypothetical protein
MGLGSELNGSWLRPQRHFEGLSFIEFREAAFTVRAVGLIVVPRMVVEQDQKVSGLAFRSR